MDLMVEGVVGTRHSKVELEDFIAWTASPEAGIGMTVLVGPTCVEAAGHLCAYAIIAESHIVVNEYDSGLMTMDVFSCKEFQTTVPVDLAVGRLDLQPGYVMRVIGRVGV